MQLQFQHKVLKTNKIVFETLFVSWQFLNTFATFSWLPQKTTEYLLAKSETSEANKRQNIHQPGCQPKQNAFDMFLIVVKIMTVT